MPRLLLLVASLASLATSKAEDTPRETAWPSEGEEPIDTADTDADVDADTDSDADSDADTDADTDVFDAYVFSVNITGGYAGEGLVSYRNEGTAIAPFARVTFYDEGYFDAGDERYLCEDYYEVVDEGADALGMSGLWLGRSVGLSYLGSGDPACEHFDSAIWPGGSPVETLEAVELGVGAAPLSSDMSELLESWIEGAGYDWQTEFQPYWLGSVLAFDEGSGLEGAELGYTWVIEADQDMEFVVGSNCLLGLQCVDISQLSALPERAGLSTGSYYLLYTSNLF